MRCLIEFEHLLHESSEDQQVFDLVLHEDPDDLDADPLFQRVGRFKLTDEQVSRLKTAENGNCMFSEGDWVR